MKANRMWLFSDVLEKNKRVFKVLFSKLHDAFQVTLFATTL